MKNVFLLLVVLVVAGCSTTSELPKKEFTKTMSGKFAPISLLIDDGTNGSGNAYAYDSHIYQRFQETGLFQHIGSSYGGFPTTIFIKFNRSSNGSTAGDTTKMLVSAATLFLVPTKMDVNYELVFTVNVNGDVKEYRYKDRVKETMHLANADGSIAFGITDNLLNHFFEEIQKDQFLPKIIDNEGKAKPIAI